jgi:hypothetical protein
MSLLCTLLIVVLGALVLLNAFVVLCCLMGLQNTEDELAEAEHEEKEKERL